MVEQFGSYRVLRSLGRGAMGEVFLAEHQFLRKRFALKVPVGALASLPSFQERFINEGRFLSSLQHPNIVHVHDIGQDDGQLYLIMDFVSPDGESSQSLDGVLKQRGGKLPWQEAARILFQVCDAIAYAHGKGVIHRDIKPGNVLMDRGGVAKVSDFGLATMVGDDFMRQSIVASIGGSIGVAGSYVPGAHAGNSGQSLGADASHGSGDSSSGGGNVVGTFHFIPPEVHTRGGEAWTPQGDVYSLGVLAYVLLVGKFPVGRFRLPHELDPELSNLWDNFIARSMEDDVQNRFERVEDMLQELHTIDPSLGRSGAGGALEAEPDTGETPQTAIHMVRDFVNEHKAAWDDKTWHRFTIQFYRTPGHDPVTEEQVEALAEEEKRAWKERDARRLDQEARQAEDRRRAATEAEDRRRAAEDAKLQLERERKARKLEEEAAAAYSAGRYGEARKQWDQVLELTPNDSKARASLQEATKREADTLGKKGQEAFDVYDYEEAVRRWEEALQRVPDNPELRSRLDEAQRRKRELRHALDTARSFLGSDDIHLSTVTEGLQACDKALELSPNHVEARSLRSKGKARLAFDEGHKAEACGKHRHALRGYLETLRLDPGFKEAKDALHRVRRILFKRKARIVGVSVVVLTAVILVSSVVFMPRQRDRVVNQVEQILASGKGQTSPAESTKSDSPNSVLKNIPRSTSQTPVIATVTNSSTTRPTTLSVGQHSHVAEIRKVLEEWVQALQSRNVDALMQLYADELQQYYLKKSATKSFVRDNKTMSLNGIDSVSLTLSNIDVRISADNTAVAVFDKEWDIRGKNRFTGKVNSELRFRMIGGLWRICSEKDLREYKKE